MGKEIPNILGSLLQIAGFAGQRQIGNPVGAPFRPREHVLHLQRDPLHTTIGTDTPPLLEQVLTHFKAQERSLLVLQASDLRVLHLLDIEAHEFLGKRADSAES